MADMYGAVRSSYFKVKDPAAFRTWFTENCHFGGNIELWVDSDSVSFGGYEQYPNAYPMKPYDDNGNQQEWDLDEFATEVRKHLAQGAEFRVLAAGNEKLRYVAATHLVVTHDKVEFVDLYEGN